jgi:hypothetical protein
MAYKRKGVRPFRVTLEGHKRVHKKLHKIANAMPLFAARALNKEAELTMTLSKRWTPRDTGRLVGTGKVQKMAKPTQLWARLTYGTKYALYVHEIPPKNPIGFLYATKNVRRGNPAKKGKRTAEHRRPTRYKFLEGAINKRARMFSKNIARSINKDLKNVAVMG